MRDRLIELLEEAKTQALATTGSLNHGFGEWYADYLLANGVVVPPVKVGDTVYRIWSVGKYGKSVATFVVTKVAEISKDMWVVNYQKPPQKSIYAKPTRYQCNFTDFGKTVFLTKSQAEEALKNEQEKL